MGFVRNIKYFCGKEYFETDLFELTDMRERGRKIRKPKTEKSSADQKRRNKKRAERKLLQEIMTNFTKADIFQTLTFDADHQPVNEKEANKEFHNYIRRLNRRRKKIGLPPAKYKGVLEKKSGKYHFHVVISGGLSRDEMEEIWGRGLANARRLRIYDKDIMQKLVKYLLKQSRDEEKFKSRIISSRNLEKPKVTKTDWRFSHRKLVELAGLTDCAEVWEELYPGYAFIEAESTFNELTGWHITVKMSKKEGET